MNKDFLVKQIDEIIIELDGHLNDKVRAKLISVREHLSRANRVEEIVHWGAELLRIAAIVHEIMK